MLFTIIIIAVVVLDQLTKLWIVNTFALYESRQIIGGLFNLTYVTNTGAAFGMLAGTAGWWRQVFFTFIGLAAITLIVFFYQKIGRQSRLNAVGLALVAGGAAGNLIDRLRLGKVIDFLDFYISSHHWPAFNVADSAICVGVGLLLIAMHQVEQQKEAAN